MRIEDRAIKNAIPEERHFDGRRYFRTIAIFTTRKEAEEAARSEREIYHSAIYVRILRYVIGGKGYYAIFASDRQKPMMGRAKHNRMLITPRSRR